MNTKSPVAALHEEAAKIFSLIDFHRNETARLQREYNALLLQIVQEGTSALSGSIQPVAASPVPAKPSPKPKPPAEPKAPAKEKKGKPGRKPKPKPEQGTATPTPVAPLPPPPEEPIIPAPKRRFTTPERTTAILHAIAPFGPKGCRVHKIAALIGDNENYITIWYNKTGKTIKGISKPKSGIIAYIPPAGSTLHLKPLEPQAPAQPEAPAETQVSTEIVPASPESVSTPEATGPGYTTFPSLHGNETPVLSEPEVSQESPSESHFSQETPHTDENQHQDHQHGEHHSH